MKNGILMFAIGTMTLSVQAQKVSEYSVPAAVKTSFQQTWPKIKDAKWEKEGANYEAEFKHEKTEYSVVLDASGKILETENEIALTALPEKVRTYVTKNYPGQKISEAAKIKDASGKILYEAEIKGKDLLFSESGEFVKESKEE